MSLENLIHKWIFPAMIVASTALLGFTYGRNYYVHQNLEPGAIGCDDITNLRWIGHLNLPLFRNKDLDGNGKYESALFYTNSQGEIVYQEVTRDEQGKLVFGEPKLYEK